MDNQSMELRSDKFNEPDKRAAFTKELAEGGRKAAEKRLTDKQVYIAKGYKEARVAGTKSRDLEKLVGSDYGDSVSKVQENLLEASDEISLVGNWLKDQAEIDGIAAKANSYQLPSQEVDTPATSHNGYQAGRGLFDVFAQANPEIPEKVCKFEKSERPHLNEHVKLASADQYHIADVGSPYSKFQAADFTRDSGWAPRIERSGHFQYQELIMPTIVDKLSTITYGSGGYRYVREKTRTAPVDGGATAEGAKYKDFTLLTEDVEIKSEKLTGLIRLTDEQLRDVPSARSYVNTRGADLIRHNVENQVLNGSGSNNQWSGLMTEQNITKEDLEDSENTILDDLIDNILAVGSAGRAMPNWLAMDVLTWGQFIKAKDDDKNYLISSPSSSTPYMLWGFPVVIANLIGAHKVLIGTQSEVAIGQSEGLMATFGYDADDFSHGRMTLRIECRGNVIVFRDTAFRILENVGQTS